MRILPRREPAADLDFSDFVREVSPRLLRTAFLLSGNQHTAEDLVQEALERACRRWHRISVTEAPEAYVRQIVVNLANDRWRRMGRMRESDPAEFPDEPDPRDEYGRLDLRDQLTTLLETLPMRMRTILVLRYLHDMDDAQIAGILNIAPGTVRSQLSRGLARLRSEVAAEPVRRPSQAHSIPAAARLPLGGVQ